MNETISVIIPAYNAEKYIRAAVQSVLDQTHPVREIIIIDDGSTDGTRQAVEELQKERGTDAPAIRYIYQQNQGPAVARNTGIAAAIGEHIAFLDADDTWLPARLKKQVAILQARPEVGLVCSGRFRIEETTGRKTIDCKGSKLSDDSYRDLWTKGNYVITSSVLVRRECFNQVGNFEENPQICGAEDAEMWLRIAQKFKIVYVNEPLIEYLVRHSGLSRSSIERSFEAGIKVIHRHEKEFSRRYPDAAKILQERWGRVYHNWGMALFDAEQFSEARLKFQKALMFRGLSWQTIRFFLPTLLGTQILLLIKKNITRYT